MFSKSRAVMKAASVAFAAVAAVGLAVIPGKTIFADGAIGIDETNFPDPVFRQYVETKFDSITKDGILTTEEQNAVTSISVYEKDIKTLKGIEYFPNLTKLECEYCKLTELDVSHNTKLEYLSAYGNNLRELDLTKNTALTHADVCGKTVAKVDITGCFYLVEAIAQGYTGHVDNTANLGTWYSFKHDVGSKENCFFSMSVVTEVVPFGKFKGIFPDTTFRNGVMASADKDNNGWLSSQEIQSVDKISVTNTSVSDITGIELFTELKTLNCYNNSLTEVDLSSNTKLVFLSIEGNSLTELDLSELKDLEHLSVYGNKLVTLDLSNNPKLYYLDSACKTMKGVDISTCKYLLKTYNEGSKNSYSSAAYGNYTNYKLTADGKDCFLCLNNSADIGIIINDGTFPDDKFRAYVSANFDSNSSGVLSDAEIKNVKEISVSSKSISDLTGIQYFTELTKLQCNSNPITELDVSKNTKLTELNCASTKVGSLDLTKNTELTGVYCSNVATLKTLDVSNCPKLTDLVAYRTGLTSLDVTKNPELINLALIDDQISVLDITNNTKLKYLDVPATAIKELAIYNCPELLKAYKNATPKSTKMFGVDCIEYDYNSSANYLCVNKDTKIIDVKPTATPTPTAKPTTPPADTVKLTLDKEKASIVCGKSDTLKATLTGSTEKIAWTTSDKSVATVDAAGKITTKMAGTVTITATAAGKSATCTVTVLYKDVTKTKDFWYAPTNYLTAAGVVKGYDKQTKFKPANDCTRAQMVTFLWRLAGEPNPKATTTKFKDVKKSAYYFKPVIWAVEQGITTGVSKTKFNPSGVCTRAQTVTFLWRMANKPEPTTKENKFKDVKKKDYFYKATLWASEKGILAGYKDGTFKPQGKCLRRQMVTFLYKYDKFINGKG